MTGSSDAREPTAPDREQSLAAAVERDVERELATHLAFAAEELERAGASPEEARHRALERFGDYESVKRACLRARLGDRTTMKLALIGTNVLLVLALAALLLQTRAAQARAVMAREQALAAMEHAIQAERETAERAPASAEPRPLVIAIGDVIETLDRHRAIDFGEEVRVQVDGRVLLHHLGWVEVAGRSPEALAEELTRAYAPYYEGLVVDVLVH